MQFPTSQGSAQERLWQRGIEDKITDLQTRGASLKNTLDATTNKTNLAIATPIAQADALTAAATQISQYDIQTWDVSGTLTTSFKSFGSNSYTPPSWASVLVFNMVTLLDMQNNSGGNDTLQAYWDLNGTPVSLTYKWDYHIATQFTVAVPVDPVTGVTAWPAQVLTLYVRCDTTSRWTSYAHHAVSYVTAQYLQ